MDGYASKVPGASNRLWTVTMRAAIATPCGSRVTALSSTQDGTLLKINEINHLCCSG